MQNLKRLLQSNTLILCCFFLALLAVTLSFLIPKKSLYNGSETTFVGKISDFKIDGNFVSLTLEGPERLIGFYYLETLEEKKIWEEKIGYGKQVQITGTLEAPAKASLPHTFDYQEYLKYQKIYWTVQIDKIAWQKDGNVFAKSKTAIYKYLKKFNHHEFLLALLLGNTNGLETEKITANGISHLFAVSGMHITLFALFLQKLLRRFGSKKDYAIILFFFFYAFLVGFTPSVMRSILLFTGLTLNQKFHLNLTTKRIFALIFLGLIIHNPFIIMDVGFQFSFLICFFFFYLKPHPNFWLNLLKTSTVAFLASIPVSGMNFYEVNALSIIWNIFFIPFVTYILYPACFLYLIFPFISPIFSGLIAFFWLVNSWCEKITFGWLVIPYIYPLFWSIYIFFLFFFLKHKKTKYLLFCLIFLVSIKTIPKINPNTYVYFLNVGQGDAALLISPYQKEVVMIDTGGLINYNNEEWQVRKNKVKQSNTIISFFHSLGIGSLDSLILTHGDYDHLGNAADIINDFKIKRVVFNCGNFNELEQELIKVLDKKKIPYYSCVKELNIDDNKLYFLNNKDYGNENDNSSVIYTKLNNHKFLFMGDAGVEVEEDLIQKYNLNDIDVLKVGHHGSNTSSSKIFINNIKPKYAIISVGKNNRYGHPKSSVLDTLSNSKIYRTDLDGSIMFKINNNKLKIETCEP